MLKNIALLAGFSTFVVIIIVGLDVYHKFQASSLKPTTQQHIESIPPQFDSKTLNELTQRAPIPVNLQEKSFVISEDSRSTSGSPTPTPTRTENPSTPSAQIVPQQ